MVKMLKEDFCGRDSRLEGYGWKWNELRELMEKNDLDWVRGKVWDDFLCCVYGCKDLS